MSQVKVGNAVFEDGKKLVAERVHGAWYYRKPGRNGIEHEIFTPDKQAHFDGMVDALTLELSDGELAILNKVKEVLAPGPKRPKLNQGEFDDAMEAVKAGVIRGLKRFGPFDPANDKRDLTERIRTAARNVIVYSAMESLRPGADGTFLSIVMRQASWILVRLQ